MQQELIFEDDVILRPNLKIHFTELLLPNDWQLLYLGAVFLSPPTEVSEGLIRVTGPTWDMHAYMIRPEFARIVSKELGRISTARYVKEGGKETACDVVMAEFHDRYPAYAVWPPMAWQREGYSNNEHCVRCNYCPDGTQRIHRENIEHLLTDEQREFYAKWSVEERKRQDERENRRKHKPKSAVQLGRVKVASAAAFVPSIIIGVDGKVVESAAETAPKSPNLPAEWEISAATPHQAAGAATAGGTAVATPQGLALRQILPESWGSRGVLFSPYSAETEKMAWAAVKMLRRHHPDMPVAILAQDYLTGLPWRKLGAVRMKTTRGCHVGKGDLRWLNKVESMFNCPFDETIFFDCDVLPVRPIEGWFEKLATDDVSFWNHQRTKEHAQPGGMDMNLLNPHAFCPHFGVDAVPTMIGGGHYYLRRTKCMKDLVQRAADIMQQAVADPSCAYWKMAGTGNIVGDEPAMSMVAVESGIKLPPASTLQSPPIACFMAPWQKWTHVDFATLQARFSCQWAATEVSPEVVHFAGTGKQDGTYRQWLDLEAGRT